MARQPAGSPVLSALLEQYEYDGIETCAADGILQAGLSGGDRHRDADQGPAQPPAQCLRPAPSGRRWPSRNATPRSSGRPAPGFRAGGVVAGTLGERAAAAVPSLLRRRLGDDVVPAWSAGLPRAAPGRLPATERDGAAAVYLPACINRIFGGARGEPAGNRRSPRRWWRSRPEPACRCGFHPTWPAAAAGPRGARRDTEAASSTWPSRPRRRSVAGPATARCRWSSTRARARTGRSRTSSSKGIELLDSVTWVHDRLLERLQVRRRLHRVLIHPTCASGHLGVSGKLAAVAAGFADEAVVPAGTRCCGMAGDRGWLHPELPRGGAPGRGRRDRGRRVRRLRLQQPDLRAGAAGGDRAAPTAPSCRRSRS